MKVVIFEEFAEGSAHVLTDGATLCCKGTEAEILFDRSDPENSRNLRAFLKSLAQAGVIFKGDIDLWMMWLTDDGKATAFSVKRRNSHNDDKVCDWQGYDFAGH